MGEPLRNRQDCGAGHPSPDLGAGATIGSAIGAGASTGQQRKNESTWPFKLSRSERHEFNIHMALIDKPSQMNNYYVSSRDGSWLSDGECSDIRSDPAPYGEYLPEEDINDHPEKSNDRIEDLYSQRTPHLRARAMNDDTESELSADPCDVGWRVPFKTK